MAVDLHGATISLAPVRIRDIHRQVRALRDDPVLAQHLPGSPPTPVPYARALLFRRLRAKVRRRAVEDPAEFVIRGAQGSEFLGIVVLHSIDWSNKRSEVGYWLIADARGKGIAAEAVALVCEWALGPLGLERLEITTGPANASAIKLARRLGFSEEGLLHGRNIEHGERTDLLIFGRLAS